MISIIDDNDSVRESLQRLMRSVGFAMNVFASAEEFLDSDRLRNTDCLILDVRLPGMNGLELQRHLATSHSEILLSSSRHTKMTRCAHELSMPEH